MYLHILKDHISFYDSFLQKFNMIRIADSLCCTVETTTTQHYKATILQ